MKKRILLIALIIISVLSLNDVLAATAGTSFEGNIEVTIPWAYYNTGITKEFKDLAKYDVSRYGTEGFGLKIGENTYDAYCVEPGVPRANKVTCEQLSLYDYPMLYYSIMNTGLMSSDFLTKDVVFRTLGIQEIQTVYFQEVGELKKANWKTMSVILQLGWSWVVYNNSKGNYVGPDMSDGYQPKLGNAEYWLKEAIKYWGNPMSLINAGLSEMEGKSSTVSGTNGTYFVLTALPGDSPSKVRYQISKTASMASRQYNDVQIKGENGTNVSIEQEWNGSTAIVSFTSSVKNGCKGAVSISASIPDIPGGGEASKAPYLCSGGSGVQSYIALIPGVVSEKFVNLEIPDCNSCQDHNFPPDSKSSDSKSTERVEPDHFETINVNLCCEPNNTSYLIEYSLDNLFLESVNSYIGVNYFTSKCNDEAYKDEDLQRALNEKVGELHSGTEKVENYCRIFCVEEMTVQIPQSITSASGKYFKLAEFGYNDVENGPSTSNGPVVTGKKSCRMKIDYRTLRAHYEQAINGSVTDNKNSEINSPNDGEVDYFNKYQQEQAMVYLINYDSSNVKDQTHKTTPGQITYSKNVCTKQVTKKKGETCYAKNTSEDCSSSSTCNCIGKDCTCEECYSTDVEKKYDTPRECTTKYKTYEIKPNTTQLTTLTTEGSGQTQQYVTNYYKVEAESKLQYSEGKFIGAKIKKSVYAGQRKYNRYNVYDLNESDCTSAVTESHNKFSGYTPSSTSWTSYDDNHKNYAKQNPKGAYDAAVGNASDAETNFKKKKTVATDLEKIINGCETFFNGNPQAYKLNLSANFHYMQVYLDGNRNSVASPISTVPYNSVGCDSGCKCNSEATNGVTSDLFNSTTEQMQDISGIPEKFIQAADVEVSDSAAPFEKNVREDIIYTAQCKFTTKGDSGEMTLYPGPTFNKGTSITGELTSSATGHKYQYALFLTTYSTEYETWWDISGLGTKRTKDKFTKEFNRHNTCAMDGKALSIGEAEKLRDEKSTKVPFTCMLNVKDGGMRIGTCCTAVTSDFNTCCDKYTVNEVFEFRIVDPKNLFPGNGWGDKAANWKNDSGNFGKTYEKIKNDGLADKTYAPENLTYAFKIDSKTIKAIKDYNDTHDYDSFDKNKDCDCTSGPEEDSCGTISPGGSCQSGNKWTYSCTACQSKFLTAFSDTTKAYVGTTQLDNIVWNSTKYRNIYQVRSDDKDNRLTAGVHWA